MTTPVAAVPPVGWGGDGPPWHAAGAESRQSYIAPAQAFGTGEHHTTRRCLELLL